MSSILPGTFICEYVGEMLQESESERVGSDEYLFDIGHSHNAGFDLQDELISTYVPNLRSSSVSEVEHGGFTIDAALCGNVGRFINHSCTPNLYAQDVLYDHNDLENAAHNVLCSKKYSAFARADIRLPYCG